ncbi:MAG: flagellar basal body L-ring protein FlgH [Bacteriovoracaceae bacterium]|jgi:flagellar basal body L-ring protein FlgH
MKALIMSLFFIVSVSSGCSSYVGKIHKEFDRADGKRRPQRKQRDQFDFYRNNQQKRANSGMSSSQSKVVMPTVKRHYQEEKRIKADDLNDNGSSGSLWVGSGDDNFLFTNDRKKSSGDIVLIDVEASLKNEITAELKRAFPDTVRKPKAKDGAADKKAGAETAAGAAKPAETQANKDEVFDRISSIVIEEINKDHLLLRGRKFLLYKNRKRLVEVQALVPRRDVTNSDTVDSSNIIESSVNVIR